MVKAVTPIPFVKARFFDRCGKPLAGGKVYTYEANTTSLKVTYKDPYGLTPNTNPIILDAAGEADIYLDGTYRIRITDRNDVLINDVEKIGSWFSDNLQDSLDNVSSAMGEALKPTLQNLNDTVDAAQVEVNRRVSLLDGAIATAAAAGAGANGWTALLVADASGMTQQQVNDKTALFYNTVGDMVADTKLKAGKAVITHGYYAPNDGGGARYLIKDTATDYSIPIANNLHAVFADSFDIRKFGIRNSATLDQTNEIQRMVNYADSRIYEIDFLGYSLMTPKTQINYGRSASIGHGIGMRFYNVHKLKNLFIANDKTVQLSQGHTCIWFTPVADGRGTFILDNVTFDPFVANYLVKEGNGDGFMHGFAAQWDVTAKTNVGAWPASLRFMTGYSFEFNKIQFVSPAVCYGLAVAGFQSRSIRFTNSGGEYWALMLYPFTDKLYCENITGVFRDDLHNNANPKRMLVTNMIHEENEVGSSTFAYTQSEKILKNLSCYRKSDNTPYSSYKIHAMGLPSIKNIMFDNIIGNAVIFYGDDKIGLALIDKLDIENCSNNIDLLCDINVLTLKNVIINKYLLISKDFKVGAMYIHRTTFNMALGYFGIKIDYIYMYDSVIKADMALAMSLISKDIYIYNTETQGSQIIIGIFDNLNMTGGEANKKNAPYFSRYIYSSRTDGVKPKVRINGMRFVIANGDAGNLVSCTSGQGVDVYVKHCDFVNNPNFNIGSGLLVYEYNSPIKAPLTSTYDPPSLANGTQQSKDISYSGVKLGDVLNVSFNQPLQGTRMWGEVTAGNQVTVYHRNDTGATVDLPSGTLTVKIV